MIANFGPLALGRQREKFHGARQFTQLQRSRCCSSNQRFAASAASDDVREASFTRSQFK